MYIDREALRAVLPARISEALSNEQIDDAIERAGSVIDVAISGRYTTPVADDNGDTPHPIDFWTSSIAQYLATCVARDSNDFADQDPVYRQYVVTMGSLADIKNGIGTLAIPPLGSDLPVGARAGRVINPYPGDLFNPGDFDTGPSMTGIERLGSGRIGSSRWRRPGYLTDLDTWPQ